MSDQRPQFTPRKKTLLNDYRQPFPMTAEPVEGAKYPAQLMWEQKNNGEIILKMNDGVFKQGAKTDHKEVVMNYLDRNSLFEALLEATSNPEFGSRIVIQRKKQFVFQGGQGRMSDNPITQATFTVVRDKEGGIHLGYSKGDYKLMFDFKGANDNTYFKRVGDERVEDKGMGSRWAVRGWVGFHRPILDQMELNGWEPPKPRNNGNQGGGNNYGGNGGGNNQGGGSMNATTQTFDDNLDDLDF